MPRGYARRFKNYSTRPSLFHEFVPLFNDKSRLDTVCIVIDLEKRRRFLFLSLSFFLFPFLSFFFFELGPRIVSTQMKLTEEEEEEEAEERVAK